MNKVILNIFLFGATLTLAGCVVISGAATPSSSANTSYVAASNDSPPMDNTASDEATQIQEQNDLNAMNASMQATEQQNEAAQQQFNEQQQQTIQTEINAMPIDNSNQW